LLDITTTTRGLARINILIFVSLGRGQNEFNCQMPIDIPRERKSIGE
jgi:hypothetical protein